MNTGRNSTAVSYDVFMVCWEEERGENYQSVWLTISAKNFQTSTVRLGIWGIKGDKLCSFSSLPSNESSQWKRGMSTATVSAGCFDGVHAISYVCVCVVAALLHWLLCECNCARWRHTQIWNKIKFGAKKFAQIWIKHKIWFNFSRFCLYGDHVDTVSCQRKKVIVSITTYLNMLYSLNTSDTGQRLVIQYKSNIITKTGNYTNIFTRTGAQDRLLSHENLS